MESRYRIRPATPADAAPLAAIERACFSDPWSQAGISETIQNETNAVLVIDSESGLVGHLMARVAAGEGEILNLAVMASHRRQGLGRRLLRAGVAAMFRAGAREAYLEVRESNRAAIELYRSEGFRPVGLRPGYYRDPPEDALVLRTPLERLQH